MTGNIYRILEKNITRVHAQASSATEKGFSHLHEMAEMLASSIQKETGEEDILRAVLHFDEASHIYRDRFADRVYTADFAKINGGEQSYFNRHTERAMRLYLCKCLAQCGKPHEFSELPTLFFGSSSENGTGADKKIAFLRNRQAFRAFECFAKTLGGVSVLYENNFQTACEDVAHGQAAYAIIPIYSTSDGRLGSFYRMIEKYELAIILTCDVDSDDGENMTTFALVYREHICLHTGAPKLECSITFDDLSRLSDITDAAYYYGAGVDSIEALPIMFSGRAGTFAVVLDLENADIDGLLCYLALEYPQMSVIGIYGKTDLAERNGNSHI